MYFLSQLPAVSVSFGFYPVFAKSGVYCLPNSAERTLFIYTLGSASTSEIKYCFVITLETCLLMCDSAMNKPAVHLHTKIKLH